MFFANLAVTTSLTLMMWNICKGGFDTYEENPAYGFGYNPRLKDIAHTIEFFSPSVVAIIDAYGWHKMSDGLLEHLFPDYELEGLHPVGDIDGLNYAILVKKDIANIEITSTKQSLYKDRNIVNLYINRISISVAYLEANIASKREEELKKLLELPHSDLIVGDLNTIFINVKQTLFGSIPKFFQNWRHFGLWLCSKQVREMCVPPTVLKENFWDQILNSPSFPLPYFWEDFLAKGIKKYTAWLWRNFFFPCPVIQCDHVLLNYHSKLKPNKITTEVVQTTTMQGASDHCPIIIKFDF